MRNWGIISKNIAGPALLPARRPSRQSRAYRYRAESSPSDIPTSDRLQSGGTSAGGPHGAVTQFAPIDIQLAPQSLSAVSTVGCSVSTARNDGAQFLPSMPSDSASGNLPGDSLPPALYSRRMALLEARNALQTPIDVAVAAFWLAYLSVVVTGLGFAIWAVALVMRRGLVS